MYNNFMDISRIDRQIDDLQRLKASYQNMQPQQPINNIITSQPIQNTQPMFEARFTTENPADVLVQNKTAFIDLKNGKLSIKELDGELKEYGLILPKDEKDLKIEELENKMKKLESSYNDLLARSNNIQSSIPNIPPNNVVIPTESYVDNTPVIASVEPYDMSIDAKQINPKKSFFGKNKN